MKAKEYAARYLAEPTRETVLKIGFDFMMEAKTLVEQRHIERPEGLLSILSELDQKWRAFIRATGDDGFRPDGYELLVKKHFPEVYPYWIEYRKECMRMAK